MEIERQLLERVHSQDLEWRWEFVFARAQGGIGIYHLVSYCASCAAAQTRVLTARSILRAIT
jgi:hypothetical protein